MLLFEQFPRQLLGGILLVLAGFGILLMSGFNTPPALQQLMQMDVPLSGTIRVVRGGRRGAYIAVPIGTMRGEVRQGCNRADCMIPTRFAVLQPGSIVRVWLDGSAIWQLQHQDQLLVVYAEVRADYQYERCMTMGLGLLFMCAGAVLIYWGLRPAPATVSFFER